MNKTSFGFKEVNPSQKNSLVQGVFNSVASGYDLMNDAMSLGLHRLWKETFVDMLPLSKTTRVIDVAGGTADIALKIFKKMQTLCPENIFEVSPITVLDRNYAMLHLGRDKALNRGVLGLTWMCGDAESLPMASNIFDIYTISFGIRNVTNRPKALEEAHRVLKKGGVFACLEFSHSPHGKIEALFKSLQFSLIPRLGQLIMNDQDSYQYLVESIARFPDAHSFTTEIEAAGFKLITLKRLVQGGVAIHIAVKC